MTYRVHLTTEAEPAEFHPVVAAGERVFAVQLALEVTAGSNDEGKAALAAFLAMLPEVTFLHVTTDTSGAVAATSPVARAFAPPLDTAEPPPDIAAWLEIYAREAFPGRDEKVFYVSEERGTADIRNARAVDLLRAAWRWPAPLAQKAGLVSAAVLPVAGGNKEFLVFVPKDASGVTVGDPVDLDPSSLDLANKLYALEVNWDGAAEPHVFVTRDLAHDIYVPRPRFTSEGQYLLPANPEGLQRLLGRIEERAPFLLWASTVMGTRALERREFFRTDPSDPKSLYSGARFRFLARASVKAMFDPCIVGLLLPVSNSRNEVFARGPVLERLTRLIAARIEQDPDKDVQEDKLYAGLHAALWDGLNGMDTAAVWSSVKELLPTDDLPQIEGALTGSAPADMAEPDWEAALAALSDELGPLAALLESEAGGESWLKARLKAFIDPATLGETKAKQVYPGVLDHTTLPELADDFGAFLTTIDRDFDASAALRNAFGAQALTAATAGLSGASARAYIDARSGKATAVLDSAPLLQRFGLGDGTRVFDPLWGPVFPETAPVELSGFLIAALEPNLEALARDPEQRAVFRPDDRPLPLQLPIADDPDAFGKPGATEFMSGLGFLIHAGPGASDDAYDGEPVHLSLTALRPHPALKTNYVVCTVDPVLPLPAQGSAGLSLPFSGAPLSSPGLAAPGAGGQDAQSAALAARIAECAPYTREEVNYPEHDRVYDLADGFGYRPSAFWVPPSGVLPVKLRGSNPFTPARPSGTPFEHQDTPWLCRRRTAIAGAGLAIATTPGARAYVLPQEVHPLSLDVPRIALAHEKGAEMNCDIYRSTGGAGSLGPGKVTVMLRDVQVGEGFEPQQITALAMLGSDELQSVTAGVAYDAAKRSLTVTVEEQSDPYWLRLRLASDAPDQVLSFADPQAAKEQDTSARNAVPLLIAPDAAGDWTLPNRQPLRVSGPRVSFDDLERWAANATLWNQTCGMSDAQPLIAALRAARSLFEATADPYSEKLKALPDPAVTGLWVMLAGSDAVVPDTAQQLDSDVVEHRPYRGHSVPDLDRVIQELEAAGDNPEEISEALRPYRVLVDAILAGAETTLTVEAGALGINVNGKMVRVPEGTVAQLSLNPLVRKVHFENAEQGKLLKGVFHPRMAELAVGSRGDAFVFSGPTLAIEVMTLPKIPILPEPLLRAALSGRSRSYGIEAELPRSLRLFSQADLITQRWRFARPIYTWIQPGVAQGNAYPEGPVVPLGKTASRGDDARGRNPRAEALEAFESEAFALRDDTDGAYTRIRLRPPGEITALDTISWPERSATYMRHRLELISRYAGAMREPRQGRAKSGGTISEDDAWSARLAILADPDAAPLGRPQLRAFLPLQGRVPESDREGPTPVSCILAEPPYADLGLADRIDAELEVKPRYRIDGTLQVEDLRKELSPDPLLSYFPVRPGASRSAKLVAEGPAGLHFDRTGSTTPAWTNAQYLLQVEGASGQEESEGPSADAAEMEESFAGVVLSRRADPGWSWYSLEARANRMENGTILRPIWLTLPNGVTELQDDDGAVARIMLARGLVTVEIRRAAVFEQGGDDFVPLWSGPADTLLVAPLGDRRYRLGVYEVAEANVSEGRIGGARLLSALTVFTDGSALRLAAAEGASAPIPTCLSPQTQSALVRSARDLLHVHEEGKSRPVRELDARLTDGRLHFHRGDAHVRVTAPLAQRRYPLHVHRRLVAILRRPSAQIGHTIDLFDGAWLADDWGMVAQSTGTPQSGMSLVLGELEMRAECVLLSGSLPAGLEALADGSHNPALRYREAIFDLKGSAVANGNIAQLRFHIRSAADPLPLDGLKIAPKELGEPPNAVGPKGRAAYALDTILYRSDDGKTVLRIIGRDAHGQPFETEQTFNTAFSELVKTDQIALTLTLDTDSERWADISLLHSRYPHDATDPDRFDFDWIFGPDGLGETELPTALSPMVLNSLPEAQARLIGLTDPIPIRLG